MKPPKCKLLPDASRYKQKVVRSLRFDGYRTLVVEIESEPSSFARVSFEGVVGFRVLDERDLCEFWINYHQGTGWLYEVEEGGWLELELTRPMFNSHEFVRGLREYFLVDEMCISVLSDQPPQIQDISPNPDKREG